ncbi:pantoate--beta-alanine ligase [Paenibacillus sp. IB182496]|uniref:Pantothenate synthetase n=1 Tax=Paenibacillus sabuli TaxID=2772509 RepID=A0A927BQY7_9BACL|nr:pantoate--beta-alanine ligase [Paenibacillus sabuli]MBD2845127.1 pantoate--beta-alanine ligase [Paenibacillus sabuli]
MRRIQTIAELRETVQAKRRAGIEIGLVPTMGALHDGHASLIRRAAAECGYVVVSIFVNPTQFGPGEDFERYPRKADADAALAEACGADAVFLPSVDDMYPGEPRTTVHVEQVTARLCGASRPGHFDGVATVVAKLLNLVQPDRAYFGLKDAQQVAVVRQMTLDLNLPVRIVPCETVREPDGLALSSRNVYLSAAERRQATILWEALEAAQRQLEQAPQITAAELEALLRGTIGRAPLAELEYAEVLRFPELEPPVGALDSAAAESDLIVALAVRFGGTRLIDNRVFQRKEATLACTER